jgi:glycerophosphoryl diester phosphodiesterase
MNPFRSVKKKRNRWIVAFILIPQLAASATQVCAHRGDVAAAPENTIPAIRSAVEKGVGMIEFDVQLSKDGRLVIMHDPTVNRTTNGKGKVEDLTFEELRALDAGSWFDPKFARTQIPTLKEVLEVIPTTIQCNVHLKNSPGVAEAAAKVIAELGRLKQCLLACTKEQAEEARRAVPAVQICNMSRQGRDRQAYIQLTIDTKCEYIQLHRNNGTENLAASVKTLHGKGVTVNYFGTEDPKTIKELAKAGVDYILTDNVDLCQKTLR